ncbi:MAG: threonine/serine exporter family protein [Fusobacteriaceae bacterium]
MNKSCENKLNDNKILHLANIVGKILLKNGAETYRVEDAIKKICFNYGLHANAFSTMTCIISSAKNSSGDVFSSVERIHFRTTNLDKIHNLNNLTNSIKKITYNEFFNSVIAINKSKPYSKSVTLLAHCGGAAFFSPLFNGTSHDFAGAIIGGFFIFWINYFSTFLKINNFFATTIGGAICSLSSYLLFKVGFLNNISVALISSLMLLVPGMSFTNSIRDLIAGDLVSGLSRGIEAIMIATSLAIGSGFTLYALIAIFGDKI